MNDVRLDIFCQMLRQNSYQGWVKKLEVNAETFKTSDGIKHLLTFLLLFAVVASIL